MLAITYALKQFFPEIYAHEIIIRGREKAIEMLSRTTSKGASYRLGKWIDLMKSFPDVKFETAKETKLQPALELAKAEKLNMERNMLKTYQTNIEEWNQDEMDEEESSYISPSFNVDNYAPILVTRILERITTKGSILL